MLFDGPYDVVARTTHVVGVGSIAGKVPVGDG